MRFAFALTAFAAVAAAAPAVPQLLAPRAGSACDPSGLTPPTAPTPLPPAPTGTKLMLVAIGRGTQNYTCGSDPTVAPSAVGAVANLYNASCLAVASSNFLNTVSQWAESVPTKALAGLPTVGQHYFMNTTTPTFHLTALGISEMQKTAFSAAPANSNGNVPWLYLTVRPGAATDNIAAVYRLETQGGSAPATCAGKTAGAVFTVPYSAQYWFYST